MRATILKTVIIVAAAGTLGGCASYQSERPKLAYFIIPCSTPGAFPAQAVSAPDQSVTAAPQDLLPDTMKPGSGGSKEAATCLVAAATGRPYSGYGYAPYYPYPRHYGSGIGFVFHSGGHRGGHHGSGHRRH